MKKSLPVILLRGVVLLPHSEIRLEMDKEIEKKTIEFIEKDYDEEALVISPINTLEQDFELNELPRIGVLAKLKLKIELEDNKIKVIMKGISRYNVNNYNKDSDNFEILYANIERTTQFAITPKDEMALIEKILKELENYISNVSYMSNSVLSQVSNVKSISKITDLIAVYLPLSFERKVKYLKTVNPYERVLMLLEDIKKQQEIVQLEQKIDVEVSKQLDKSQREFILREKLKIIKEELGETNIKEKEVDDLKNQIDRLDAPCRIKEKLQKEVNKYEMLSPNSPEISMVRSYIDFLLNLPWNNYTKDNTDLNKVKKLLDASHYGLDKIKIRIIEFLAVNQITKGLNSPIICLVGPPGVGKTTLARSIANSINRKFIKITVGGITDEAEIIGHRRAYIGSGPGRIINGMKKVSSANPVFIIDEIDKIGKNYKGDPASCLLEVLDKEQNISFYDNYIEEEFDLSKVMFILTANNLYQISEPLRDRLEIIELSGYTEYEKLDIVKKHLLPKVLKEHGIESKTIKMSKKTIMDLINYYTKEAGVRELERLIATICRKIVADTVNKKIIDKKDYIITTKDLEKYLGKRKYFYTENNRIDKIGVANGLVYTQFGGDILPIEVTFYKGKGNLILTGSLGDIIKESANIALSYIKTHYKEFGIDYKLLEKNDIHIHLPEGAIPKDGPSAGITLTTALISAFVNKPVNHKMGMTGEITLRGQILPVGGLKEKSIGAYRSGITKVLIPKDNERDLEEIPLEIRNKLKFIPVNDYKDVYNIIYNNINK